MIKTYLKTIAINDKKAFGEIIKKNDDGTVFFRVFSTNDVFIANISAIGKEDTSIVKNPSVVMGLSSNTNLNYSNTRISQPIINNANIYEMRNSNKSNILINIENNLKKALKNLVYNPLNNESKHKILNTCNMILDFYKRDAKIISYNVRLEDNLGYISNNLKIDINLNINSYTFLNHKITILAD